MPPALVIIKKLVLMSIILSVLFFLVGKVNGTINLLACGGDAGVRCAETAQIPQFALHGSDKGKKDTCIGRQ